MAEINVRRAFPSSLLEIRIARLQAILAAHQSGIGDDRMTKLLVLDALSTAHNLADELMETAEYMEILDTEDEKVS